MQVIADDLRHETSPPHHEHQQQQQQPGNSISGTTSGTTTTSEDRRHHGPTSSKKKSKEEGTTSGSGSKKKSKSKDKRAKPVEDGANWELKSTIGKNSKLPVKPMTNEANTTRKLSAVEPWMNGHSEPPRTALRGQTSAEVKKWRSAQRQSAAAGGTLITSCDDWLSSPPSVASNNPAECVTVASSTKSNSTRRCVVM